MTKIAEPEELKALLSRMYRELDRKAVGEAAPANRKIEEARSAIHGALGLLLEAEKRAELKKLLAGDEFDVSHIKLPSVGGGDLEFKSHKKG